MPDDAQDRPLALGELTETESPEIVRAALGRFRRRLLVRALVVILIAASAVVLYPRYFDKPNELPQEILEARGVFSFQSVEGDFVKGQIVRVARLSDRNSLRSEARYGIQLHVSGEFQHPGEQIVTLLRPNEKTGVLDVITGDSLDTGTMIWIALRAGTRVIDVPFTGIGGGADGVRFEHPKLGTLHLDMDALDVPGWIWRKR